MELAFEYAVEDWPFDLSQALSASGAGCGPAGRMTHSPAEKGRRQEDDARFLRSFDRAVLNEGRALMDSQDRDESKIRRREETLARRVGEALDQMKPHGSRGVSRRRGHRGLRGAGARAGRIGAVGRPFRDVREVQKDSARARRIGGHAAGRERSRSARKTRFGCPRPG